MTYRIFLALAVLVAAFFISGPSKAGTATLQAQYSLPDGFSQGNGSNGCGTWLPGIGGPCIQFPGIVLGWYGTMTVKSAGIELLSQITCGGQLVWQGEQFLGTVIVQSPSVIPQNISGPCILSYQAGSSGPSAGFEAQVTFFYQ